MPALININTRSTKELTQLPGIRKNLAYRIVNHRQRHGYFTHWEELLEVKEFPEDALDDIKKRASLLQEARVIAADSWRRKGRLGRTAHKERAPGERSQEAERLYQGNPFYTQS